MVRAPYWPAAAWWALRCLQQPFPIPVKIVLQTREQYPSIPQWLLSLALGIDIVLGDFRIVDFKAFLTSRPSGFCYSFLAGASLLLRKVLPGTSWVWFCFCDHGPLHPFLVPVSGYNLPSTWLRISTCWRPQFILCFEPCIVTNYMLANTLNYLLYCLSGALSLKMGAIDVASASSRNMLEIQNLRPYPRSIDQNLHFSIYAH